MMEDADNARHDEQECHAEPDAKADDGFLAEVGA